MAKPTLPAEWASDANYPADGNPYDGTPTKTNPTSGRKQRGWEPGKKIGAQGINWLENLLTLWIIWLDGLNTGDDVRTRAPLFVDISTSGGAIWSTSFISNPGNLAKSLANGDGFIDLEVDYSERLKSVSFWLAGDGAADLNWAVSLNSPAGVYAGEIINQSITNPTTNAKTYCRFDGHTTTGLTVTVVAGTPTTYTRSTGSYLTEGFYVGQYVTWGGFVNGGNNGLFVITVLSATVMSVTNAGSVNEGPVAATSVAAQGEHTTSGLTVTVTNTGNGVYTRSSGSFLTAGFIVGESVTWSGFTNPLNNVTSIILSVTATVMTTTNSAAVPEGPTAATSVFGTRSPTIPADTVVLLRVSPNAANLLLGTIGSTVDEPAA